MTAPRLVMATIWRTQPPLITLYYDSPTLREVVEYRRYDSKRARKETRRLADLCPEKHRWMTDIGVRYDDLNGKAAIDKIWREAEAEIEAALQKDEHNSNWARSHYYLKG